MPETITIDRHALRLGAEAAGWLIILKWMEDGHDMFHVNNQIHKTLESAEKEAASIASSYTVTIKAVRFGIATPKEEQS